MFFDTINNIIWGPWMLFFVLGTSVFLLWRLKCLPIKNWGYSLTLLFNSFKENDHAFEYLMTSLGAMMGTGNILGVSSALILGGPGSLFWMNVAAVAGMTISYAENMLAIKYQQKEKDNEYYGGPMYVLLHTNIPLKIILAALYAIFTFVASLGMGNMTQSNSIAIELKEVFGIPTIVTGMALAGFTLIILIKETMRIEKVCSYLVPIITIIYVVSIVTIILMCSNNLLYVLTIVLHSALNPKAIIGGTTGTCFVAIMTSLRWGVARGIFSNEVGMGSSAIALASNPSKEYVKHGYLATTNVFIDTIVMCTLTGLAILSSYKNMDELSNLSATALIHSVFTSVLGSFGGFIITICIVFFGFATIIGWAFYGKVALRFLSSKYNEIIKIFPYIYSAAIIIGATSSANNIWNISDICNGLMMIPNLICIIAMSKEIKEDTIEFEKKKSLLNRGTSHYRARRFLK